MSRRYFMCSRCNDEIFVDISVKESTPETIERICEECGNSLFESIATAPYFTFGLHARRANGQNVSAVKGWGTHVLDYGKKGSDLVKGRANEIAVEMGGKYHPDDPPLV